MNDPHGIVWDGCRYHMFFQYVRNSLKWESNLDWGHAVSDDLVHWRQLDSALTPDNEVGCWSGSAVNVDDGFLLYYSRPIRKDWSTSHVVVVKANSELTTFERINPPVITEVPDKRFYDFRDPQVRRDGNDYVMTIGAGIRDFGGCALQYRSHDALQWEFDGILAARSHDEKLPIATGTVWECPQFLKLGTKWCLIISSINPDSYHQVHYALGDYDGKTFQAETWGNLGFSEIPYATTTFHDNDGNSCMMSWLKESGDVTEYAGAQSIPMILREIGGNLQLGIHPNLQKLFKPTAAPSVSGSSWTSVSLSGTYSELVFTANEDSVRIRIEKSTVSVIVNEEPFRLDVPFAGTRAEILIDADILEVLLPEFPMAMAFRIPANDRWDVSQEGAGQITLRNYLG